MSAALATVSPWSMDGPTWRDFVSAEVRCMQTNPEWVHAERSRCFAADVTRWDQGFLYWAMRHWHLVDKQGQVVLLRPNVTQIAYLERRGQENVILKARKPGMSTIIDALYYWRARQRPHQHLYIMAHVLDSTDQLWDRVKFAHDRMPSFLRAATERSNRKELKFKDNRSHLHVLTAGGRGSGRAADADGVHLSEFAHYPDPDGVLAAVGESVRGDAWIDIESTPNGYNRFRVEWKEAKAGATGRVPHFFAWYDDPTNARPAGEVEPTPEEEHLQALRGLSLNQIAWRRDRQAKLREKFLQEHPEDEESCFLTGGIPKFNNALLKDLLDAVEARVRTLNLDRGKDRKPWGPQREDGSFLGNDNGRLSVWVAPKEGHRYVIGADVAEGLPGRAYSVAGVLDVTEDPPEQVAEWHGHIGPGEFGDEVLAPLGVWYNRALVAPERNNHGHATLKGLKDCRYYPVYQHRHYDQRAGATTRRPGWPTDGRTRPIMFDDLRSCLDNGHMIVRSAGFVGECMAFQAGDEDKDADAGEGSVTNWRDRVFAWGIAWQVRKRGVPVVVG